MSVDYPAFAVRNQIRDLSDRISYARELSRVAGVGSELLKLYDKVEDELIKLKDNIDTNDFSTEYANQLAQNLDQLFGAFPRFRIGDPKPITLQDDEKEIHKNQQERDRPLIEKALSQFGTTFYFFAKLDFLNTDLVIVGANGSGKTFLGNNLLKHIKGNGVIVSAQRILHLPAFDHVKNHAVIVEQLKRTQVYDKTNRNQDFNNAQEEFEILIQSLLADNTASHKEYARQAHENVSLGVPIEPPAMTRLERTLNIWNALFSYPQILHDDGVNIRAHTSSMSYSATEMSEGEKVTLFLIAQVLQSPENGFVIVDEPEMYLHPTIHKKLWDRLESERPDAIFIYLTHDLDFASSRTHAKKLWLRSFSYPDKFTLEDIPSNEIPRPLLLELLGSRRNIIFCEGEMGSLDEMIYSILFSNYIVKPVGGCLSVISFTKAFNKIPNSPVEAIGIIDADYHSLKRLNSLMAENIYGLKVAEVENLLFDEVILTAISDDLQLKRDKVLKIKEGVLNRLLKEKSLQISNYVSARVDHYFKDTNVPRGKDLSVLKSNYKKFIKEIDIESWGRERGALIDEIIINKDYHSAIQILNYKGLESIANGVFKIRNFNERAVYLLKEDKNIQNHLLNHFPQFSLSIKV